MDHNLTFGKEFLHVVLDILEQIISSKPSGRSHGLAQAHAALEVLSVHLQEAWLKTVLVIIYKVGVTHGKEYVENTNRWWTLFVTQLLDNVWE